jgi:hypothetical protein
MIKFLADSTMDSGRSVSSSAFRQHRQIGRKCLHLKPPFAFGWKDTLLSFSPP